MAIFAELNGLRVRTATVIIPYHGIWHADVVLDQQAALSGALTLILGDLTLKGSVYRSAPFIGTTQVRMLGGAGGWMKQLPAKEYKSSFGVKFSVVAKDAARECGETLSVATDFAIGLAYERQKARAGRVLDSFAPLWWMGTDGITQVNTRPAPTVTSPFDMMSDGTDLGAGKVTVASDAVAVWQPGAKFSSTTLAQQQVSGVVHKLDKSKLRTELWIL